MISENKIDAAISQLFSTLKFSETPANLYDPLRYMISIGGKRIRPKLCLTTYSLYKDTFDETVLQPAAGLEIFHSFTLIHDDIMDRSPLRRGVPTVWTKWGEDGAILSGDVMCIDSYKRMAKAPAGVLEKVLDLFSTTASEVCDGQQLDMDFEKVKEVSMTDYMKMIGLKTGVLIACSAKMGALIAGASEDICDALYNYGYSLGLAFQVADDYLDAFGDEKVFGKPIGGDIINQKKCWLTTRALEKADDQTKASLLSALEMKAETEEEKGEKISNVRNFYTSLRVDEDAKYEILRLNEEAMEHAAKVCRGVRLETLRRFADKLVGRTK
ncbi:MAG: polyprenyl synthetase family protein [Bacteroidales bacterium]|nr:polyprenyl synthetase family protein [Bacteroidales bacterium]